MACREYEDRIMEMVEGGLCAEDQRAVQAHVAGCETCRRFAHRLKALEAALATENQAQAPSPGFKARLMERVDLEPCDLSAEAIAARRRDLEVEFEMAMAGLARAVWRRNLPLLLEVVGLISAAFIAVRIVGSTAGGMQLPDAVGQLAIKSASGYMTWAWAAGAMAAGLSVAYGTRLVGPQVRRLISDHINFFRCA